MDDSPPAGPAVPAAVLDAQQLERVLAVDPRNAGAWTRYGEILLVQGRCTDALHAFRHAARLNPGAAEAHYRVGVAFSSCGMNREAVESYGQALSIKADFLEAWNNLGGALDAEGRLEEAAACYERAVAIAPHFTTAVNNLGLMCSKLGRWDRAALHFRQVLDRHPGDAGTCENLGIAYYMLGHRDEAATCFRKVLALRPDSSRTWNNLGNLLSEQDKWEEARPCFERAIELNPDSDPALNNLGVVHLKCGRVREAEALFRRALALRPEFPDACNNLGLARLELGHTVEAEELFRTAVAMQPNLAKSHNHLGMVLRMQNRIEESIASCRQALALQPDFTEAFVNLGNSLSDSGRIMEAISVVREGLRLHNDHPALHVNLAIYLLALGRFEEGWGEYEWRWQSPGIARLVNAYTQPRWRGEAATGQVLLLWSEQGFGDTIQFCRYAPLAAARGLRVVLMVQPALARLLASMEGVERIVSMGSAVPDHDFQCPLMSLPMVFRTELDNIPADVPYLFAEENAVLEWRERLPAVPPGTLKVGLVWAGNAAREVPLAAMRDRRRSIAPQMLAPLLDAEGVRFYSLQKAGPPAPAEFGLIDLMGDCRDFADTAALIANLDLVISVDTAAVHLAGALGKPVWVLNRFDSCWRWLPDREDNPWYPGLRLFTQARLGDWESVIARVREELVKPAAGK